MIEPDIFRSKHKWKRKLKAVRHFVTLAKKIHFVKEISFILERKKQINGWLNRIYLEANTRGKRKLKAI